MKLSLFKKILIALGIITAASLLLVWIVVRPKYEASIFTERLTVVRQLQKSFIDDMDHTIAGWSNAPRGIISQVTERPSEGETILRMAMALHPEIIQIRIHSSGPSDELRSQNTSYPPFTLQFSDSVWVRSKTDSTLSLAWLAQTDSPTHIVAMQTPFQVQRIPFTLTVVWDAKRLNDILAGIPFDKGYSVSIYGATGVIAQNTAPFSFDRVRASVDTLRIIRTGTHAWHVLTSPFHSAQMWMAVAVPEEIFTQPVEHFLLYSAVLIVAPMFLLVILGWLLSYQIKRFIKKMKPITGIADETTESAKPE